MGGKFIDDCLCEVFIELYLNIFLRNPSLIKELRSHLSRLRINAATQVKGNLHLRFTHKMHYIDFSFASYQSLEAELRKYLHPNDLQSQLKSIYNVKDVSVSYDSMNETVGYISLHGKYMEKLYLSLGFDSTGKEQTKKLINCVADNCPNLKQIVLRIYGDCLHLITRLIKTLGKAALSFSTVALIVKQCPRLKSFKASGIHKNDRHNLEELLKRFLRMPHLDRVKFENVLVFAPHIWDVLHFQATTRRFNSVSEQHMQAMRFVDLRLPYESNSEKADTIREGIRRLIKKFGVNLNEIKILQHESWFLAEGVIDHLSFVPKTISKLVAKNKTSSLAELLTNLVSDTMTVKKQSCIGLSDTWIDSLLKEMDAFDESIITGIKQDLSAVERLDICIEDPLNIDLLVRFCNLFSNLKLISLNFGEIFGTFLDTSYVPKMIDLLDRTDSKVCIELSHSLVLTEPVYIAGLRYYLDRLKIDSETEHSTFEVYTRVDDYEEVEAVLRRHLPSDKIEDYLRSLCRVKTIQEQIDSDEELENSMKCIAFHGKYTEKI
ncbi:hypothetical protein HDE_00518 [Halotydeus destructor]|nr:hypothetical protein HDE_00518 [Halotydeus destructor]